MRHLPYLLLCFLVAEQTCGWQKCTGNPRMLNGKKCASTTRYGDFHKGACGCGPDNSDNQFDWNHSGYNTAPNQLLFDHAGGGWCGENCGRCVRLTTTGGWVDGNGGPSPTGSSKVFMVTNLCPNEFPNLDWCSQWNGRNNQFGYQWHFDLENGANQISGLGWINAEVTWEWTDCDDAHRQDGRTANSDLYKQCFCGKYPDLKRSLNETFASNN